MPSRGLLAMPRNIFGCGRVQPSPSGPGILLTFVQYTRQQRILWPQMSPVERVGNPALGEILSCATAAPALRYDQPLQTVLLLSACHLGGVPLVQIEKPLINTKPLGLFSPPSLLVVREENNEALMQVFCCYFLLCEAHVG